MLHNNLKAVIPREQIKCRPVLKLFTFGMTFDDYDYQQTCEFM